MVPCSDGTKDGDRGESCDPLSPEREPEPRLDGPDKSSHFTPFNNFFILHNTYNNNTQQEISSTLGVSVSRTECKETNGFVERLQVMKLARRLS
jgi:hypothetical protein